MKENFVIVHDNNGRPIYPGDVLKTFYNEDRRGRRLYMYHVACFQDRYKDKEGKFYLRIVPAQYLNPTSKNSGGDPLITEEIIRSEKSFIVQGHGPEPFICFTDRPRKGK